MKQKYAIPILLVIAACATTPQGRELQAVKTITNINDSTVTALDFGIIKADEGVAIQALTRAATVDLKRAIAARRAGQAYETWDRLLNIVDTVLVEASRILAAKERK